MDDDDDQAAVSRSTWPPPPFFWKDFTPSAIERIEQLRRDRAESDNVTDATAVQSIRLEGLPRELRNLQPPAEPADGRWRVFGANYQLADELPSLDGTEIRRLVPNQEERDQDGKHFDRALVMKRLAKSLLLNFLELTGVLSINPAEANDKILDLRDLFYNFHHLINEYRPHQARESLISMMQATLDRTRAETNAIRDAKEKVERVLEGLGSLKVEDESTQLDEPRLMNVQNKTASKKPAWMADSDEIWGGVLEETI
ncbi:MED7 protein-domain-containing protein [Microdochium bolleyi]|uniref:Mediator of RNA polymerase II transcription subunit 7 n=1 Tax=Microdochium bolleyi TaxID=196109 RepID=A0A136IUG7_9PEZI|nr:MED7 protein-domain-containing protein [Microdochium bolleyi]